MDADLSRRRQTRCPCSRRDFLARGLKAFRHMRGADEFLRTVETRERLINDRLFGGLGDPLALRPSDIGQMAYFANLGYHPWRFFPTR